MNAHRPPRKTRYAKANTKHRRQAPHSLDVVCDRAEMSNVLIFPPPGFGPCQSVANLIGMALAMRTESNFGRHACNIDALPLDGRTAIILRKLQTSALDGDPAARLVFEHLRRKIQRSLTNCR